MCECAGPNNPTLAHLALALIVLGALRVVPADLFTMPSPHLEVSARLTVGVLARARAPLALCARASPCACPLLRVVVCVGVCIVGALARVRVPLCMCVCVCV